MAVIYETQNFIIESREQPFVSREEGGHVRIRVKDESITDRTKLTPKVAKEYMRISMMVGIALQRVMNLHGVPVVKVNYQDMGNWAYKEGKQPYLHYHIFGRVLGAKYQPYPESVLLPDRSTGFYDPFVPLTAEDCAAIKQELIELENNPQFLSDLW